MGPLSFLLNEKITNEGSKVFKNANFKDIFEIRKGLFKRKESLKEKNKTKGKKKNNE